MKKLQSILFQLIVIYLMGAATVVSAQNVLNDKQSIRSTINSTYDSPEYKVIIDPVVVKGKHAVASWIQQKKGGRVVLFRNTEGEWDIVLCSGKAVKDSEFLIKTGILKPEAEYLAKELASAETNISKEKIALFDSFKGVMRSSDSQEHKGNSAHSAEDHSHH